MVNYYSHMWPIAAPIHARIHGRIPFISCALKPRTMDPQVLRTINPAQLLGITNRTSDSSPPSLTAPEAAATQPPGGLQDLYVLTSTSLAPYRQGQSPVLLDPDGPPPLYRLSRTISSVANLLREWTVGLGSHPVVERFEGLYGAKWRPRQDERVFYGRCLVIIKEIKRRQGPSCSQAKAIQDLEVVRTITLKNGSLHKLSNWLKTQQDVRSD